MSAIEIISIYQPPDAPKTNAMGEQYDRATETVDAGSPDHNHAIAAGEKVNLRWPVRARREDKGGREQLIADALVGNWHTRFTVIASRAMKRLDERWWITDSAGLDYDIEAVVWKPGSRRRQFWLYATRRTVLRNV